MPSIWRSTRACWPSWLRNNKYPFVSSIYSAVRKTEDHKSTAYKLYQFLFTKKGADMIDESGYIAIKK